MDNITVIAFIGLTFGVLPLTGYIVGWWTTSHNYRHAAQDRSDLREERRFLLEENKRLSSTIFELERKVIILETKLAAAMDQIAQLSSQISQNEES